MSKLPELRHYVIYQEDKRRFWCPSENQSAADSWHVRDATPLSRAQVIRALDQLSSAQFPSVRILKLQDVTSEFKQYLRVIEESDKPSQAWRDRNTDRELNRLLSNS